MLENILTALKNLPTELIAVFTGGLGFFFRTLWQRFYKEKWAPSQELLDLLEKNRITKYGRNRLQEEAEKSFTNWRSVKLPPGGSSPLTEWPPNKSCLVTLEHSQPPLNSTCPTGDSDAPSTPLFIRIDASENPQSALNNQIEELTEAYPNSDRLLRLVGLNNTANVWVNAPNILIRSIDEALEILESVSEEVRKNIPNSSVVLEVYLALSIRKAIRDQFPDRIISSFSEVNLSVNLPAKDKDPALYAFSRNTMDVQLKDGVTFGSFDLFDRYEIPNEMLVSRIGQNLARITEEKATWRTLTLTGPPGSGKTVTGDFLVQQLSKRLRAVVLIASSSPTMLQALAQISDETNKEEVFENLAKAVSAEESMIPPEFKTERNWQAALTDVLLERLRDVNQPTIIAVDNLHLHQKVSASIQRLRDYAKPWDLRLLLISRPEIPPRPKECLFSLTCNLWSRQQTKDLLNLWISESPRQSVIEQGWLQDQNKFSLYLIETVAINADHLAEKPTDLLRRAIEAHLSSLKDVPIQRAHKSPKILLDQVRDMLERAEPTETILEKLQSNIDINLVQLFGILAWFSLYQDEDANAFLDETRIVNWSSNAIASQKIARQLMNTAGEAKIFNCSGGIAGWRDMLVADGCAALYLAEEIQDPDVSLQTVARNVRQLELKNSIDILTLILNPELVLRIIEAGTTTSSFRASTLQKIVNEGFIGRLRNIPNALVVLGEKVLQFSQNASIEEVEDIAVALARVARVSPDIEHRLDNIIQQAEQNANFALAAKAIIVGPHTDYFTSLPLPEDHFLQPIAVDSAGRIWGEDGFNLLHERLAQLSGEHQERNLKSAWLAWLNKQDPSILINCCHVLISKVSQETACSPFYGILLETTLQCFLQNTSPAEKQKFLKEIRDLRQHVYEVLSLRHFPYLANTLKWLTYQTDPDAVRNDSDWLIRQDYAIQKEPNFPARFDQVFQVLKGLGVDYALPHSDELSELNVEGRELVSDRFPSNFQYGNTLLPGQLSVATQENGQIISRVVDLTELESKFLWRVRLTVPPESFMDEYFND